MSILSNALAGLGATLLAMSGRRVLTLEDEACGIIFRPGGPPEPIPVTTEIWKHDETLANALMAGAILALLRDVPMNHTLESAIETAGREMGYPPAIVEALLTELLGSLPGSSNAEAAEPEVAT